MKFAEIADRFNPLRLIGRWPRMSASALAVLLVIAHAMLADHAVEAWHGAHWGAAPEWPLIATILGSAAFYLAVIWGLWSLKDKLFRVSATMTNTRDERPHDVLILTMSPLWSKAGITHKDIVDATRAALSIPAKGATDPQCWIDALAPLIDAPRETPVGSNWQQPLRAIHAELGMSMKSGGKNGLRRIIAVTNKGSIKTYIDFHSIFAALLASWPLGPITLESAEHDMMGEDFMKIYKIYSALIDEAEGGSRNSRVCIAVTGGTKEMAIPAAIATLNREMTFCNVDQKGNVKFYDANVSSIEPAVG